MVRTVLLWFLVLGPTTRLAAAQDTTSAPPPATAPAPPPAPRFVVDLDMGTAFGNTEAHLAYTGGVGVSLGSHVEVSAEFGRMDNIVTKSLNNTVRNESALLSAADGTVVQSSSSVPAEYGLGDVRLSRDCSQHVGVYVDGGVGLGHERPQLSATAGGSDVSAQVLQSVTLAAPRTTVFVGGGGGISIRVTRRARVDAGYRFGRLGTTSPAFTNTLYGGWRLGW